jgi:GNAT superfamily N-acetyltransferase
MIVADTAARRIRELRTGETQFAHEAMRELRGAYADELRFAEHVDHVLRPAGYRLVGAFLLHQEQAVAVAGFRTGDSLAWGHYLYVDDLSTSKDARRQGHAGALLDWLIEEARSLGCAQLHLDSGTGPERFDAHRLYHKHGLSIHSHHFARGLA